MRLKTRWTLPASFYQLNVRRLGDWAKVKSLVMVRRERRLPKKTEIHTRYYISSLKGNTARFLNVIRSHWGVENSVHWVLDMCFNEDQSRLHKDNGAENFAVIRHIALNLLRSEKTVKVGVKAKRLKTGWDDAYLLKVLSL